MSTTTGSPLNLNKFAGGDKVYDALTTLFNQNMDKLNSALTNIPKWQPNTSYVTGNLVRDPYHSILMMSFRDHTSSEQTSSESDWGPLNGNNWVWLDGRERIYPAQQGAYIRNGAILTDDQNGQLLQADTDGVMTDHTWVSQNTHLLADNIPNWEPNRKYNIGDLVFIGSLGDLDHGQLYQAVLRCKVAHTSGVQIGANLEGGNWGLINPEAYHITQTIGLPYTKNVLAKRDGLRVVLSHQGQINNGKKQSWWASGAEVVPEQFRPVDMTIYIEASIPGFPMLDNWFYAVQPNGKTSYIHNEDPSSGRTYIFTTSYYTGAAGMTVPAGIPTV